MKYKKWSDKCSLIINKNEKMIKNFGGSFDLWILCNILIYFDINSIEKIWNDRWNYHLHVCTNFKLKNFEKFELEMYVFCAAGLLYFHSHFYFQVKHFTLFIQKIHHIYMHLNPESVIYRRISINLMYNFVSHLWDLI